MIDIKKLREDPDFFRKATADKQRDVSTVDQAIELDEQKRKILGQVETLRAERNKIGKEDIVRGKEIKIELDGLENQLKEIDEKLQIVLLQIPNPALPSVPVGQNEEGNVEIKQWGEIKKFDFQIKTHFELGDSLDLFDTDKAGQVSGTRFGYLKNEAVLIEMALINYGLTTLIHKGFLPMEPPVMIKKEVMGKLGYNNFGFDETYVLDQDNLCLIATAEHALVPYLMDEVIPEDKLPLRLVGFSPAFRREAGSYGKDTKGILRMHQFNKLEMVSFVKPEESEAEHQYLISIEEEMMQALKIPYHVVQMCTGDLGDPAANKNDIESWFPSENKYRETHSCSNCTDYQSRRLNIRLKRKTGEMEFVHVLNGTVFSQRPILAILENYQQADGSVVVPEVLQSFVGKEVISPKS